MLGEVTVRTHKHAAYQTLMQQPRCLLSDPICAAVWITHRYFCCKAFYRYKKRCLILLLLLLASDGLGETAETCHVWSGECRERSVCRGKKHRRGAK